MAAAKQAVKETKKETVYLPFISGEDPYVFIGINGQYWQIPRGQKVEVPEVVAEQLRMMDAAAMAAQEFSDQEIAKSAKVMGLS